MTKRNFKMLINKIPSGEYDLRKGVLDVFQMVCPKSRKGDTMYRWSFVIAFDEYKFSLEHMTDGRVRYVGTGNLSYLVVE